MKVELKYPKLKRESIINYISIPLSIWLDLSIIYYFCSEIIIKLIIPKVLSEFRKVKTRQYKYKKHAFFHRTPIKIHLEIILYQF